MTDTYGAHVALLLHCDGTNGSTTFTDNSLSAHTVTAVGTAALSTAQQKFGTASIYGGGTSDFIALDGSSDFSFGTGDFTIEGWIRTSWTGADAWIYEGNVTGTNNIGILVSTTYGWSVYDGPSSYTLFRVGTLAVNTWTHFALTRAAGALRLFVNGTRAGADRTSTTNAIAGSNYPIVLGGTAGFTGYLDDFRVTKGIARYTSNFTAPTAAFDNPVHVTSDIYPSNTKLLLNCNGTNGSTTFTDSAISPHTVNPIGTVALSTAQKKYGTASASFSSGSNYLSVLDSADWDESGDWTIETWVKWNNNSENNSCLFSLGGSSLVVLKIGGNKIGAWMGGSATITGTIALTDTNWHHIALVRYSGLYTIYVDGTADGTYSNSSTLSPSDFLIGQWTGVGYSLDGYLDDFRVTQGVARYISNFIVPEAELPTPFIQGVDHTITGNSLVSVTAASTLVRGHGHPLTGSSGISVTPTSAMHVQWHHSLIGASPIAVIPYSAKVYTARNHRITGNVKIETLTEATLAHHATHNVSITGSTTISVTPASATLWRSPNHYKTGGVTIALTPVSTSWERGQYQGINAALNFAMPTVSATAHENVPNSLIAGFITTTLSSYTGANATGGFIDTTLSATGTLIETISADLPFFTSTLSATATVDGRITASLGFLSSTVTALGGANAALTAPTFSFSASAAADNNRANTHLGFLNTSLSATGTFEQRATFSGGFIETYLSYCSINIPAPLFTLTATASETITNSVAYVLNVHTGESTKYSNYPFSHIIHIGSKAYGVTGSGLYLLEGTTDVGTAINATITSKETDFGTNQSKRLDNVYLNSDASTTITPFYDGTAVASVASGFSGRRTKMAKGAEGRYVKLKIEGIQSLQGMEITTHNLLRRVK